MNIFGVPFVFSPILTFYSVATPWCCRSCYEKPMTVHLYGVGTTTWLGYSKILSGGVPGWL